MPKATVLLKTTGSYARDAFVAGLARAGYEISETPSRSPTPADILVTWNRTGREANAVRPYDLVGARVLIAENGYVAPRDGSKRFALAITDHNGAGAWPVGGPERFEALGLELKPWRSVGDQVVVLPQRGIGRPGVAMPQTWTARVWRELPKLTERRLVLRRHPGPDKTEPYDALRGAHAAVTWGSGAGIKALAVGVPVFFEFPRWIGAPAARLGITALEKPWLGDRLPMFQRLAWAQWSREEIESGEAFAWLLRL